jgi:hypothetical protein
MFNIRLLTKLGFKGSLFNSRVRAMHIKVFNIFNGFRLEFKVKARVLKKRGSLIIKSLIKAF